jgi:hypothetical protein
MGGLPRSLYGLSHDAMVGEYVFSSAHDSSLTPEFPTSFCPSCFTTQEAVVAPKVSDVLSSSLIDSNVSLR